MEELIAKRYVKALNDSLDTDAITAASDIFQGLAAAFENKKFLHVIENRDVPNSQKEELLLDAVKNANSDKLNNFIKLLVENGRINIIPAISIELTKQISRINKSYGGKVYSDTDIDAVTLEGISKGLGKKMDATISLEMIKNDFDGIKVEVEDLGVEVNFSKSRLNAQLIEHILKAI
jgi:F-type H+-transporting ATPase subunit delta